ncbi:MAG: response regulator [Gammaproteobacteria bacterium]|nr:response regulator [Gammaproteobacteria bacterium]
MDRRGAKISRLIAAEEKGVSVKKILLVDDHDLVRLLVRKHIEEQGVYEVVGEARSGEEALDFVRNHQTDAVVLDINMPGIGGLETTRILRKRFSRLKIIVVSVHAEGVVPQKVLELGVHAYLTKASGPADLLKALDAVARDDFYIDQKVGQSAMLRGIRGVSSPLEALTPREFEVMSHIVKGRRVIDIASSLSRSPKTISTLRSRVCDKLGVRTDVELTLLAIRLGLVECNESLAMAAN